MLPNRNGGGAIRLADLHPVIIDIEYPFVLVKLGRIASLRRSFVALALNVTNGDSGMLSGDDIIISRCAEGDRTGVAACTVMVVENDGLCGSGENSIESVGLATVVIRGGVMIGTVSVSPYLTKWKAGLLLLFPVIVPNKDLLGVGGIGLWSLVRKDQ